MPDLRTLFFAVGAESLATSGNAASAIDGLDTMNSSRPVLGADHNRLLAFMEITDQSRLGLTRAASEIADVDYATEPAHLSKLQFMRSAGVSPLAQSRNLSLATIELLQ